MIENRPLCLTALAASLLLSLWSIYLDPVINNDGILYVQAAEHFLNGQWAAGLSVYKWPFYSLVISAASAISGFTVGHAAYAVNGGLYVLLMLGFVALVRSLAANRTTQWVALLVALAHPTLNEFRPFIIRDIGYWACYLWALAYFFAYLEARRGNLLVGWVVFSLLAFLFRVEGILLVTVLPACLHAVNRHGRKRVAAVALVVAVAVLVLGAAPLWQYLSEVDVARQPLIVNPIEHIADSWQERASAILERLDSLRWEFTGIGSRPLALTVYISTVFLIMLYELVKTVGVVFSGLIVYAASRSLKFPRDGLRRWWGIVAGIQAVLVFQFVFANFFLADRYTVALGLTVLVFVPFCLEQLWRRWRQPRPLPSLAGPWRNVWPGILVGLLLLQTMDGLDVATEKHHIKEAGLWLRGNAPAGSSIYSNDQILIYYSGLDEARGDSSHTWKEAMSELWTDKWQTHDYFALVMSDSKSHNEVLLLKRIGTQPVKRFSNEQGDSVLIFHNS